MAKPVSLEFHLEDNQLFGFDPIGKADYKILWCANGSYSHYVLSGEAESRYVYTDEKDPLYRSIYDAEMRLVYKAVLCTVCKTKYIDAKFSTCYNCKDRERKSVEVKYFYPTFYKSLKADVSHNYRWETVLKTLIEIAEELNLTVLQSDLQAALDHLSNEE